jgi:hypothetical protein
MEIIVRLSIHKFLKTKEVVTVTEALEKMFEVHVGKFLKSFDCHVWRSNVLWCEQTDIIFKSYMPVLKMLY